MRRQRETENGAPPISPSLRVVADQKVAGR
jgi:hypothetical protein